MTEIPPIIAHMQVSRMATSGDVALLVAAAEPVLEDQVRRHAYFTFDDWRVRSSCFLANGCNGKTVSSVLDTAVGFGAVGVLCCVCVLGSMVLLRMLKANETPPGMAAPPEQP